MHDIVYILKNDINRDCEELRYSLRSVEKNFPHARVWFAGGKPDDIEPDRYMPVIQKGPTKWERVKSTLKAICKNPEISDDFWLFNDDFFVMLPILNCPTAVRGTMSKRIRELMRKNNLSQYAKELYITKTTLEEKGYDSLDYALHIPILINKAKALETLRKFNNTPMFRCCYGNQHEQAKIIMKDVKILRKDKIPTGEEIYLSTSNEAFNKGEVGKYIREQFPEKSKYEIETIPKG